MRHDKACIRQIEKMHTNITRETKINSSNINSLTL